MKKIFNWTFGSFFRTIGRVIAFLVLGSIFAYFVSKSGLKVPHWLTMRVSASTIYQNQWINDVTYKNDNGINTTYTNPAISEAYYNTMYYTNSNNQINQTIKFTSPLTLPANTKRMRYEIRFMPSASETTITDNISPECTLIQQSNGYAMNCIDRETNTVFKQTISISYWYAGNTDLFNPCYIENYYQNSINVMCPVPNNFSYNVSGLKLQIRSTEEKLSGQIGMRFFTTYEIEENDTGAIQGAINNQTQQQHQDSQNIQNKIDDVNDTINDDDTSEATSSASNLFNNYEDDDFGLSGIITAPLDLIESMISPTCNPIKLTGASGIFEDVDIELPCLTPLYEEFFGNVLDIYQMITFGIISYKIVVDIFRWVRSFKNPDEDRLEVIDL